MGGRGELYKLHKFERRRKGEQGESLLQPKEVSWRWLRGQQHRLLILIWAQQYVSRATQLKPKLRQVGLPELG